MYKFCERQVMKICNRIQIQNSLKHENHQNDLIFKVYDVMFKLKYTYISKHNESTKVYAWGQVAQGCICITVSLDKIDIYMKLKHKHEKHV